MTSHLHHRVIRSPGIRVALDSFASFPRTCMVPSHVSRSPLLLLHPRQDHHEHQHQHISSWCRLECNDNLMPFNLGLELIAEHERCCWGARDVIWASRRREKLILISAVSYEFGKTETDWHSHAINISSYCVTTSWRDAVLNILSFSTTTHKALFTPTSCFMRTGKMLLVHKTRTVWMRI